MKKSKKLEPVYHYSESRQQDAARKIRWRHSRNNCKTSCVTARNIY